MKAREQREGKSRADYLLVLTTLCALFVLTLGFVQTSPIVILSSAVTGLAVAMFGSLMWWRS